LMGRSGNARAGAAAKIIPATSNPAIDRSTRTSQRMKPSAIGYFPAGK
jgi:hypothetical protein